MHVVDPYNKIPREKTQTNAMQDIQGNKREIKRLINIQIHTKYNSCGDNQWLKRIWLYKRKWGLNSKEFKIDIYTINQENSIHFPDDKLLPVCQCICKTI